MKKWQVIIILAVAQFVMVLDSTVMNVSISTVAADLGTTISGMQAAITLYALTMAALMLTGGKFGDKWGRRKAFVVGSVVYGIGSLMTALSPNLTFLLLGWSLIEGLGAILVIPAIASLTAINYSGRDRVVAFSIIGAVAGIAAAAGPLIGGLVTTYFSWRYVFAAETAIMLVLLLLTRHIKDQPVRKNVSIDVPSSLLSASGLALLVFGVLQSKTWGWVNPLSSPEINGVEIAPLGISLVAYFILAGIVTLWFFFRRQRMLEQKGKEPLVKLSFFSNPVMRAGLSVLLSQYFAIAAIFFVVPVYLQTILGYDALQTGVKLVPMSIGLIIFSILGSRLAVTRSARNIARWGQVGLSVGILLVLASIQPELRSVFFLVGMFVVGAGLGLLASQLGNVIMSAVGKSDTAVAGGLQGTFQNLGNSFGTAVVGSVFMLLLASGFTSSIQASPDLSSTAKTEIAESTGGTVGVVSEKQAKQYILDQGATTETTDTIAGIYEDSQIDALRTGLFVVFVVSILALLLSRNLPATVES